jgi:hypothetical protein
VLRRVDELLNLAGTDGGCGRAMSHCSLRS